MDVVRLLVRLGLQSVRAHKRKSIIVGGLMAFGAFIVVIGTSLLDSVERSMRTSLVDSVTGDIQVYDKKAKDELQIFGGFGFGASDVGEIPKFSTVRDALLKMDNVKAVVPMGITNASVSSPGDMDRALGSLRDAVRSGNQNEIQLAKQTVRRLVTVLAEQRTKRTAISSNDDAEAGAIIAKASSDEYWQQFDKDPLPILDELDGKLAPLGEEGQQIYLRLAGTDLDSFREHFSKMRVLNGQMVPSHQRGLLVGQKFLDRRVKFAIAMNLDTIRDEIAKGKTIATDQVLQETVTKNQRLSPRIIYMLSAADAPVVEKQLRDILGAEGDAAHAKDLGEVLVAFLKVNDDNFATRYKQFYDVIAPHIQLYPFKVGDTITLTAFTTSGYLKSVNVKVYGTYAFEGLESSDLAGALSLVDMITFRELYGARTQELDKELVEMKKTVGAGDVKREDAEAELFGGGDVVSETKQTDIKGVDEGTLSTKSERTSQIESGKFEQKDVDDGLALSAAVLLKDPSRLWPTMSQINKQLGDSMQIQAVDWQRAAGIVGQFIWVIRGVLTLAILIIFAVAIVIINNSMVMATLERVAEIGTMRAIGAGKGFVTWMIIFETGVLGLVAGGIGGLLGALLVTVLHAKGIPAGNDVLVFLFGGPKLYPFVSAGNLIIALIATVVVSVAATLYPARLATRIQPVVAMQGKE